MIKTISTVLTILFLYGCSQNTMTFHNAYDKDYSDRKIFYHMITVNDFYKGKIIRNQVNSSKTPLKTFLELEKEYSIESHLPIRSWTDSMNISPAIGNKLFKTKNKAILIPNGLYLDNKARIFYVEKNISKDEYEKMQQAKEAKIIQKIDNDTMNYLAEHNKLLKKRAEYKEAFLQPINKNKPCKILMEYTDNKYFKDESWKVYWDGRCKNGFATGLGREIEQSDTRNRWQIAIYKNGKAKDYYILKDIYNNYTIEGLSDGNISYSIKTTIFLKNNDIDIDIQTLAGKNNVSLGIRWYAISSPFLDGQYTYVKGYHGFNYAYENHESTKAYNKSDFIYNFAMTDTTEHNGWVYTKRNQGDKSIEGAEIHNNTTMQENAFTIPPSYVDTMNSVIKEVYDAQQKAYTVQDEALKLKRQYIRKICKNSVTVDFMNNSEYKSICHNTEDLEILAKINAKLQKQTEEKIAKIKQQTEEKNKQELLALERVQKTEQTGHLSRNHPATKNGEYPATYNGADSAIFYKVRDFILS